jgi:hypothetical protein
MDGPVLGGSDLRDVQAVQRVCAGEEAVDGIAETLA